MTVATTTMIRLQQPQQQQPRQHQQQQYMSNRYGSSATANAAATNANQLRSNVSAANSCCERDVFIFLDDQEEDFFFQEYDSCNNNYLVKNNNSKKKSNKTREVEEEYHDPCKGCGATPFHEFVYEVVSHITTEFEQQIAQCEEDLNTNDNIGNCADSFLLASCCLALRQIFASLERRNQIEPGSIKVHLVKPTPTTYVCQDHAFLVITTSEDADAFIFGSVALPETLLIALTFKRFFTVARPSKKYERFLETVPEIFVGTPEQLKSSIDQITAKLRESFKDQDLSFPPWREANHAKNNFAFTLNNNDDDEEGTTTANPKDLETKVAFLHGCSDLSDETFEREIVSSKRHSAMVLAVLRFVRLLMRQCKNYSMMAISMYLQQQQQQQQQ